MSIDTEKKRAEWPRKSIEAACFKCGKHIPYYATKYIHDDGRVCCFRGSPEGCGESHGGQNPRPAGFWIYSDG